jgi:hypothetical protein
MLVVDLNCACSDSFILDKYACCEPLEPGSRDVTVAGCCAFKLVLVKFQAHLVLANTEPGLCSGPWCSHWQSKGII